jgi:hypothetical protein
VAQQCSGELDAAALVEDLGVVVVICLGSLALEADHQIMV